jgi:mono/diheme cytochrome c family protein
MSGRLRDPVDRSIPGLHASRGVSCHTCHGGNPKATGPAMSIAAGFNGAPFQPFINTFCGRCHQRPLFDVMSGAHGRSREEATANCVSCHGSHQVGPASPDLINEQTCSRCHSFERVQPLKERLLLQHGRINSIQVRLKAVKLQGRDTAEPEQLLTEALRQTRRTVHRLGSDYALPQAVTVEQLLNALEQQLNSLEAVREEQILNELQK